MNKVLIINTFIILLLSGALWESYELYRFCPHLILFSVLTITGLLALQGILFFRLKALLGFARVLLYTLALLQGLRLFLSLSDFLSITGILNGLFIFVLMLYLLGVRGFLQTEKTLLQWGVKPGVGAHTDAQMSNVSDNEAK